MKKCPRTSPLWGTIITQTPPVPALAVTRNDSLWQTWANNYHYNYHLSDKMLLTDPFQDVSNTETKLLCEDILA